MSGKTYLRNPEFFKRNYFEALKYILPGYLYEDDISTTEKDFNLDDVVINSHIDIANNFSSILPVSANSHSTVYSSLGNIDGASVFFVKQNNLTNITTKKFEDKILSYFDRKFTDFQEASDLETFLESTLIPAIRLNASATTADVFSGIGGTGEIQDYLINNLSWLYLLNTSGFPTDTYDGSAYVKGLITSSLYNGVPVKTNDGIKGLSEFVWKNNLQDYYPTAYFASGTRSDLSGIQQLEKLQTWADVLYSPLYADQSDFKVRDKFEIFIDSQLKSSERTESGPFARLIRALSFLAFDINNDTEEISTLYDLDDCPDEYLPLLAQLIGWDLFGSDPQRWRLQLRSAVSVYKAVGTKKAVQKTVETVFPKNKFPIEGRLTELWESYVPYLIYYALATESPDFRSFDTWTRDKATDMDVEKYSTASMDENIRLAVDKILLDIYTQFPDSFPTISRLQTLYNYRGRDYQVPPFEEYPYYVNTELTDPMLTFIADRLACFGCGSEFATQVSGYIYDNAMAKDDEPKLGSWLIFTSGYNAPPNLDSLIRNLNDNRFDYASLWSGKSSHFKLVLSASEFDFTKKNLDDIDSQDALNFVSRATSKVTPAHAIPLITLDVSGEPDTFSFESGSALPIVYIDREEIDVAAGQNILTSGIHFKAYKRGLNPDGEPLSRSATQSLASTRSFVVSGPFPRNTARRRSYEKVMPFNGYYDRTGFNMPVDFNMASGALEASAIPLGLIPSSLTYAPVSSHVNLPDIWQQCEGPNSINSYYQYNVSNAPLTRGASGTFQSNKDRTVDRGQLPGIYAAMHRIDENRKYLKVLLASGPIGIQNQIASSTNTSAISELETLLASQTSGSLMSTVNSLTNSGTEGYTFPNNVEGYYNFAFGRDLHRLYRIYQSNFNNHRLSDDIQQRDGANIFSHTYGPLLYNHDFDKLGINQNLISTSFENPDKFTVEDSAFTGTGSYTASDADDMYLDTFERVSSGIVDGVELVLTSGTSGDSSFSVIRVPGSQRVSYEDPFLFDKTVLLMRSGVGAATRLRFDISKYAADSGYPIANNFLSPEHDYKVTLKSIVSRDSGLTIGGRSIGAWIHTKPEGGKMWSYTPGGSWVQHDQLISRSDMLTKYAHAKFVPSFDHDPKTTSTNFVCLNDVVTRTSPVLGLEASSVDTFEITFNTKNRELQVPRSYQALAASPSANTHDQLHRLDQNYVIEAFMFPGGQSDEFMLIDKLEVQDMTMSKLSQIFAAGTLSDPLCDLSYLKNTCDEYRVYLSKQDLFDIFKHFNDISGKNATTGYASRDSSKTETIMEAEGGSRIDYRYDGVMITTGTGAFGASVINKFTIKQV